MLFRSQAAATQSFEPLKQYNEHGAEYWSARDLQPMLGYSPWRRFEQAVDRAKASCAVFGPYESQRLPMQRRHLLFTLAAAGLAGCAGVGGPRHVLLSQADLQARIERHFPHQRRVLELIDVTVARPNVRLLPERNRIATDLDLIATERLSGRTVRGNLVLDYALRYEPADASLRLTQVQVQQASLDLGSGPLSPSNARIAALLAERVLDDFAIYRADPERLKRLQRAGDRKSVV